MVLPVASTPADRTATTLREFYHALRPLRWVLWTACRPALDCLESLAAPLGCELLPVAQRAELPGKIRGEAAHFGVAIDDDGEICRLWDDAAKPFSSEQFLLLLGPTRTAGKNRRSDRSRDGNLAAIDSSYRATRRATDFLRPVLHAARWTRLSVNIKAILGGGASGRVWHSVG